MENTQTPTRTQIIDALFKRYHIEKKYRYIEEFNDLSYCSIGDERIYGIERKDRIGYVLTDDEGSQIGRVKDLTQDEFIKLKRCIDDELEWMSEDGYFDDDDD